MRVEVREHGVEVSDAVREHVERRLRFARFRERVEGAYASLGHLQRRPSHIPPRHPRATILRTRSAS